MPHLCAASAAHPSSLPLIALPSEAASLIRSSIFSRTRGTATRMVGSTSLRFSTCGHFLAKIEIAGEKTTKRSLNATKKSFFEDKQQQAKAFLEQEQTKFYDLRQGITEDFQRLAKFNQKAPKRFTNFKRFCVLTFFDL